MGITVKDKIEQFKRDCKSITYYQKVIRSCEEDIARLDQLLSALGQDQLYAKEASKKALLLEQDQCIANVQEYKKRVKELTSKLNQIKDETDKQMVIDAFIAGVYYKKLISQYHFNDSSALYRHINKVIEHIVEL